MRFDLRFLLIVPTVAAIFFVVVGYYADGTAGLYQRYNQLASPQGLGLYVVLAIAYIVAICLAYRYLARRPKRIVAVRMS